MKFLLVLALAFAGCAVSYSTDGQKRSVNVGFTPDYKDFKAIKELTR